MSKVQLPVHKGELLTGTISDLTYQGNGVLKVDHYPLFVPDALPGEEVEVRVTKVTNHFGWGQRTKLIQASPDRVADANRAYLQTGIAPLGNLTYPAQLRFKQHQIEELLAKAHLAIAVKPTLGMAQPTGYRNKAQVPVRMMKGQPTTGFFKRGSHDLVPMENFLIQDPAIDQAVVLVRDLLRKYHVPAYDERTGHGVIRTVMVRRGYYSHQVMVVLVTNGKRLPHGAEITREIVAGVPGIASVVQNINDQKTNVILGAKNKLLWGKPAIHDQLLGIDFTISPRSFYQVNPQQTERLYQAAIDQAGLNGSQTVIDAYCGIGTISLAVAKHAKRVYGVEIVPEAIEDAKQNAVANGITNVDFEVGKAEDQMAQWQKAGLKPDVVIVDPPRKGLDPQLIEATAKMAPEKVIYVSCNPATLVRDLTRFQEQGYQVTQPIQPVDQFPQTTHVESITVMSRS